jgi:hypothetical protein
MPPFGLLAVLGAGKPFSQPSFGASQCGDLSPSLRSTVCYFFCKDEIETQLDGKAILRALIHQLLVHRQWLIKHVKDAYNLYGSQLDHNFNELWRIFIAITSDKRLGPVSVIIDAIDECKDVAQVEEDAQPDMRQTIEGVLGPLARIWDSRIYLVHLSLKEFLQSLSTKTESLLSATFGVDPRKAHLLLAKAWISYLLLEDFKEDVFSNEQQSTYQSPISVLTISTKATSNEVVADGAKCSRQPWDPFDLEEDDLFKNP